MIFITYILIRSSEGGFFLFLHEVRKCLKVILLTFLVKKIYPRHKQDVKLNLCYMKNKTDESSLDSLGEMIKNLALKCSAVTSGIRLGPGATDEEKFVIYLKGCCEQSKRLDESMTKQLWLITSLLRTLFTFIFEGIDDEQVKQQCKKIFFDSIPRNALVLVILYSKLYVFKGDEVLKDVPVEVTEKEIRELFHMTNDQIFEELMA